MPLERSAATLWRNLKVKYRIFDHLLPYGEAQAWTNVECVCVYVTARSNDKTN